MSAPALRTPVPVVVVGFGRMGQLHARTLQAMPEFRVVGVVDPDPACIAVAADMGLQCHATLAHLAVRPTLAFVAVPSTRHAQVVLALVRQGIHCLVEKPAGVDACEVAAMIAAAELARVQVFVGYSERFNPVVEDILGDAPTSSTISVRRWSAHALHRAREDDVLLDLLSHDIDWLMALAGAEPRNVVVNDVRMHRGKIETIVCRMQFACGMEVELSADRIAAHVERTLALSAPDGTRRVACLASRPLAGDDALTAQARDFLRAVQGKPHGLSSLEDAFRVHGALARLAARVAAVEEANAA